MGYTLIIDNYDSFTWNVYADVAVLGGNPLVKRNDKITITEIQVGPSEVRLRCSVMILEADAGVGDV